MSDLYQELVIDAFNNPQHLGDLKDADASHHEYNASCGDDVTVFVKYDQVNPEQISKLTWQGNGCVISQATMSLLAEKIISQKLTTTQIQALTKQDLEQLIGVDQISPGRLKCLTLGLKAIQKAIAK